jgi:hypothetical protein
MTGSDTAVRAELEAWLYGLADQLLKEPVPMQEVLDSLIAAYGLLRLAGILSGPVPDVLGKLRRDSYPGPLEDPKAHARRIILVVANLLE